MTTQTAPAIQGRTPNSMKVGLFIPCYIDVIYPEVGIATFSF